MKVNFIASARDEDCGINDYTTSLESVLDVPHERTGIKSGSLDVLHYTKQTIAAVRSDADIVHLQHEYGVFGPATLCSWPVLFILLLTNLFSRTSVVVTLHTAWDRETPDPPLVWLKLLYIWLNNRLLFLAAEHVIFLSESAEDRLVSKYGIEHYSRLPHGVQVDTIDVTSDEARDALGWNRDEEIVVMPGYIRPQKGYETFLEVARRDERRYIVAGGLRNEEHENYVTETFSDPPENLERTGILEFDEFRMVFVAADLCYLPYDQANQSGIVNWAFAHGLPVVGSDLRYFQTLSKETDGVMVTESPDDARAKIDEFFSDETVRERMREAALAFADENSMEAVAAEHEKIYDAMR